MKRRAFFSISLLLLSSIGCLSQQQLYPSIQQFLQEREIRQRFSSSGVDISPDLFNYAPSHVIDGREVVDAFIGIDNAMMVPVLEQLGVMVNCVFDGFVTSQIPIDRLEQVSRLRGVNDVEISHRMTLCTDSTMSVTHVNQVHNGVDNRLPASYDGSGVIVGIIDRGFDYQHRAYRRNDNPSLTRIVRIYSTTDKTGHKARYNKVVSLPGSVFMGNEIYALRTDTESSTHGTHTSSIAAGSHVNGYGGMAPGADIVLCAVSVLDGSMSAVEVANCVRYIDSYADSVGQPCVMSMSVSTPNGPRDGNDYFSKVVKQTTGPGRIFVISAGNDAGRIAYAHRLASASRPFNILFKYKSSSKTDSTYFYTGMLSDIWMRKASVRYYYKFHILDQWNGRIVWESALFNNTKAFVTADEISDFFTYDASRDTVGYIQGIVSSSYSKYRLEVKIHNLLNTEYTAKSGVRYGRYALGLTMYPQGQTSVEIDAWACNSGSGLSSFDAPVITYDNHYAVNYYAAASDSCCIGTYAVGDSTISAGAFAARNSFYSMTLGTIVVDNKVTVGDIGSFSSYQVAGAGPTGVAHPTICAPGITVVAAGSRYSSFARGNVNTVMQSDDGSYWGVMSGTSMSAPTVAGIIALWLQANPRLSVAEVKDILAQTAIKDQFTNGAKHDQFGPNGKIDAYAGMMLVLKRLGEKKGDVNFDGEIDVNDVVMLINYLLGKEVAASINVMAADMDEDGELTVNDVVLLINLTLEI